MDGTPTKPAQPPPGRNQPPWWGAGQSPGMKGQPAETRVASTRPRLEEEVWARWKRHWRSHRQLEEVHEPRTLRPVLGNEGEEGPVRPPKLRQHPGKNGPRRKSTHQETVPGLEERVRPRRERVSVGREKDGAAAMVRSGTQVDQHRPPMPQRSKYFQVKRPCGTGELVRTGERVRENIADPRKELQSQSNPKRFRPTEDPPGQRCWEQETGCPPPPPPPWVGRGPRWHCRQTRPSWSLTERTGSGGDRDAQPATPWHWQEEEPPTGPTGRKQPCHPSEAPSRRLKRQTKRQELGTPAGKTHRERSDLHEAPTEVPKNSPETTAPELNDPTDPKSGEGKSGANSSAGGPLEPRCDRGQQPQKRLPQASRRRCGGQKSSEGDRSLETRSGDGEAIKVRASMTTPR